ncbi:Hok/Gef family protein [Salmonella enterica]|nr:Hok/Gef family protein [Salmonella enterica]EIE5435909.1 Hok/Gef family protein [Salmonella enterica]EIE5490181.1 Hok/Gef family protein [Salmonella enterica]EIE5943126.1 Hok/Gef family protein [Salmonella enterica]EJI2349344.1 Hok/Gef family protein [Salmonella enterica]
MDASVNLSNFLGSVHLTRKSLCEIWYRDTNREVAAFMAYESAK